MERLIKSVLGANMSRVMTGEGDRQQEQVERIAKLQLKCEDLTTKYQ